MPISNLDKIRDGLTNALSRGWEERAIMECRDIIKTAFEDAGNGLWEWNLKNNKVRFSKMWKIMLGYETTRLGNDIYDWKRMLHPDDREDAFNALSSLRKKRSKISKCEYRILHSDGTYRRVFK